MTIASRSRSNLSLLPGRDLWTRLSHLAKRRGRCAQAREGGLHTAVSITWFFVGVLYAAPGLVLGALTNKMGYRLQRSSRHNC